MSRTGVHFGRTALFHQRVRSVNQRARRVNQVVHQNALLALDVADDIHNLGHIRLRTALINDGKRHVQLFGELTRTGNRAKVGRDDDGIVRTHAELARNIWDQHGGAEHIVHRDIEKALNLRSMQVHGQHAVCARGGDKVGNQLGRDRVTRLALAILPRIAKIRDNRRDTASRRALAGVDHDEQLHQVVIDRTAGGLHQKYVRTAHGLGNGNRDFTVRESGNRRLTDRQAERGRNLHCQGGVRVAGENFDIFSVRNHW